MNGAQLHTVWRLTVCNPTAEGTAGEIVFGGSYHLI